MSAIARFIASGDVRETSPEIMDAIASVAGTATAAVRVWGDPAYAEALAVWERVTCNGLRPSCDYCWGASGSRWARDLGLES